MTWSRLVYTHTYIHSNGLGRQHGWVHVASLSLGNLRRLTMHYCIRTHTRSSNTNFEQLQRWQTLQIAAHKLFQVLGPSFVFAESDLNNRWRNNNNNILGSRVTIESDFIFSQQQVCWCTFVWVLSWPIRCLLKVRYFFEVVYTVDLVAIRVPDYPSRCGRSIGPTRSSTRYSNTCIHIFYNFWS